jgi:two-component system, NtrC family, response regulator AtoC
MVVFCGGNAVEHPLPESGVIVIGRGSSADITIDHTSISRRHAKLAIGTHVTVEDCGSHNGTSINGRKLQTGEVVLAMPGAPIELGDAIVLIRSAKLRPASPSSNDLAGGSLSSSSSSSADSIGTHASLDRVIARVAQTDVPVVIVGEAGTGKLFVARQLHEKSARRRRAAFITLRCANLKDAREITAASIAARGGTLVIHEPTTLSAEAQNLLAVTLDAEGGSFRTMSVSSRDMQALASRGQFSEDLLHRLAAVSIVVPPLRSRLRDLPAIAESLVTAAAAEHGRPVPLLSADALTALGRHAWPGNVRELKNALTRAVLLGSGRVLTAAHFELDAANQAAGAGAGTLSSAVNEAEHRRILEALRQCNGNQTRAAKMLGISRGTLISRLERYAVPRPRK